MILAICYGSLNIVLASVNLVLYILLANVDFALDTVLATCDFTTNLVLAGCNFSPNLAFALSDPASSNLLAICYCFSFLVLA